MVRILVRTEDSREVEQLRQYGKIVFLSSLVDIVGVETTEAEVEKIKELVGEEQVRYSARGTIQKLEETQRLREVRKAQKVSQQPL